MSQSTVTQRLKSLEESLGVLLFERHRGIKEVVLTPEGYEFRKIALRYKSLEEEANNIQFSDINSPLKIGCIDSLNYYVFSPFHKEFTDCMCKTSIQIITNSPKKITELVEAKEIDVGLLNMHTTNNNIKVEPLFEEKMILAINSKDIHPSNKIFHPNELKQKNELFIDWGREYKAWHNFCWDPLEYPSIEVDNLSLLKEFLYTQECWTILPISIAESLPNSKDLNFYRLSPRAPNRKCYIMTHQNPNPNRLKNIELFDICIKKFVNHMDFAK